MPSAVHKFTRTFVQTQYPCRPGESFLSELGLTSDMCPTGGGALVLGQDQDQRGEGFNPVESFVGSISQLNIWDRVLTPQQVNMKDAPLCCL